jgi:hypothetical protein
MTKEEAIEKMKCGIKMTHRFFDPKEWITMQDNFIVTEEGSRFPAVRFWKYRTEEAWDNDWQIF